MYNYFITLFHVVIIIIIYVFIYMYICSQKTKHVPSRLLPVRQKVSTVHHVPKCTNYHVDISGLVITGRVQ